MRCFYCNRLLDAFSTPEETANQWHHSCVRKFFGTESFPEIDLNDDKLLELAKQTINRGLVTPGVQKKVSLEIESSAAKPRTLHGFKLGYIIKPQSENYPNLPESENLGMRLAESYGLKTVPHALIKTSLKGGSLAYITKRIDRQGIVNKSITRLAMEDFCQLSERLTEDKYKGSYEHCARLIRKYSIRPGLDLSEFYLNLLLAFISGNTDMHLKKFSLIETKAGSRKFVLSPAYDLVPTKLLFPKDLDQTALTLNGKKNNIRRKDFLKFADTVGLDSKAASRMIDHVVGLQTEFEALCANSYLPDSQKNTMKNIISGHVDFLK